MNTIKTKITVICTLLLFFICNIPQPANAQIDTEFWVVTPEINNVHHSDAPHVSRKGAPVIFRFTTFDLPAKVTFSLPADPTFTPLVFDIPASTTYSYQFWREDATTAAHEAYCDSISGGAECRNANNWCTDLDKIENFIEGRNISKKGILIKSTAVITCYLEIGAFYNREIIALKGKNAKGKDFYVPFQTQFDNYDWPDGYYAGYEGYYWFANIYSAVQVVATENATRVTITPTKDMYIHGTGMKRANMPYTVTLNKGEVFVAVPYEQMDGRRRINNISKKGNKHLAGTRVVANKPVVVETTDDLIRAVGRGNSAGVDFVADQLVPNSLLGSEYIVMKAQGANNPPPGQETAYILATVDNTPIYIDGSSSPIRTLNAGEQFAYETGSSRATYITSKDITKRFSVLHVSGMPNQLGGAILPPIDNYRCTGSFEVAINRSDRDPFKLIVLVRNGGEGGFTVNGDPAIIQASAFQQVQGTDWSSALITYNAPINEAILVKNNSMFHLGTLMGQADCFYGYFSDFNTNRGKAVSATTDGNLDTEHCPGDTIVLRSQGGFKYVWKCYKKVGNRDELDESTFLTSSTVANPIVKPQSGICRYDVEISRTCYEDTLMSIYTQIDSVSADFEIKSPTTCCSPVEVEFENKSYGESNSYYWDFSDGVSSQAENPPKRNFVNKSNEKDTIMIGLTAGNNCFSYHKDTLVIYPEIKAQIKKGNSEGCAQSITQKFSVKMQGAGPFVDAVWNWGDGTGTTSVPYADAAKEIEHTFWNNSLNDTTYHVTLTLYYIDSTCPSYDTKDVFVPGLAQARFSISNAKGCSPLSVDISNNSNGDVTYQWWIGDTDNFTGNPTRTDNFTTENYVFTNTGDTPKEYYVYLKIAKRNENNTFCHAIYGPDTILVYPQLSTTISPSTSLEGCQPFSQTFTQTTTPDIANNYYWDFGDGTTSGEKNPPKKTYRHLKNTDQNYQVSLITSNEYGCRDTATPVNVKVYSYVDAKFTVEPDTSGCSPFTVNIKNNTPTFADVKSSVWKDNTTVFSPSTPAFSRRYTNTNNTNSEHIISLTNSNGHNACDVTYSKTIVVKPEITAKFTSDEGTVCDNTEISFSNKSYFTEESKLIQGSTASYYWTFGDGSTSSEENPKHIFKNTEQNGISTQEFKVNLTIDVGGCTANFERSVFVYPKVSADFSSDKYILCAPEDIEIRNDSRGAAHFLWTFSDGTSDVATHNLDAIRHSFNNSQTNNAKTVTVTLKSINQNCSVTTSKNYTVYPKLSPEITADISEGCAPLLVNFTNASTGGAFSDLVMNWDFGDEVTQNSSETTLSHTFENKSGSDLTREVKLTITNKAGCVNSITKNIEVWPQVTADFTYQKQSECTPTTVTLENTSLNGTTFEWNYGFDGQTQTTNSKERFTKTFRHTNANPNEKDIYTITLNVTDANHPTCKDVASKNITIYPPVKAEFSIEDGQQGCSPLSTQLKNSSTGYKLSYVWTYGDDNLSAENGESHTHSYKNLSSTTKKYTVRLLVSDSLGCIAQKQREVEVYRQVKADFTFLKDGVCTPYPVNFSYPETALNGEQFTWDFGDGATTTVQNKNNFSHTYDNLQANAIETYNIKLNVIDISTGCKDEVRKSIEIYPQLKPKFDIDKKEGCEPLTVVFTNQSTGLANYQWTYGDGQFGSENNPEHIFSHFSPNDERFSIALKAVQSNTGCEKTVYDTVTVYSHVRAKFGLAKSSAKKGSKAEPIVGGCHPFSVEIVDSSQTDHLWEWDFGDGQTGTMKQPGIRTYTNDDSVAPLENKIYDVKLQVTNSHGCFKKYSSKLKVYPHSVPDFSVNLEGCHPHRVKFKDLSVTDDDTKYYWTLGDGSSKVSSAFDYTFLNFSYTDRVTYKTTLRTTTAFGCADSISKEITVNPKPLASFIPKLDRNCPPFQTSLKNISKGTNLIYNWNFDNGETKTLSNITTEHPIYDNLSTDDEIKKYNPTLLVETEYACKDTLTVPIYVFPRVVAKFEPDVREGCSPLTVSLKNLSNAASKIYRWNLGDENSSGLKNPKHIYYNESDNDQKRIIQLYAESNHGCKDSVVDSVSVYITPKTDFDITEPVQIYPNDSVIFTNLTQPGPWKFLWNFGNNDEQHRPENKFTYSYGTWGPKEEDFSFYVKLLASSDHCQNERTHKVKILAPRPELSIEKITPGDGCVPLTVTFNIQQKYSETFQWEFGDGGTSDIPEPIYTFEKPGIFNVKLTVAGAGGSWFAYSVVAVYPLPKPTFKIAPDFVMLPNQKIQTYNLTTNGVAYHWNFGDGGISEEENPNYLYSKQGVYDITLVATSKEGCVDSLTQQAAVTVSGEGYIDFPNAFLPKEDSPSDGSFEVPDVDNKVFHPIFFGIKKYQLWIFNRWGEQVFYSNDINVGWNGRYANNGKKMKQDVYFWKTKGEFENGVTFKKAGDVTLLIK